MVYYLLCVATAYLPAVWLWHCGELLSAVNENKNGSSYIGAGYIGSGYIGADINNGSGYIGAGYKQRGFYRRTISEVAVFSLCRRR